MPQMTIQQAFELGAQRYQAGQLPEAEGIFRQLLSAQPNHADAMHFLGLVLYQTGRAEMGIDLLRRAIAIGPQSAYCCNLGRMLAESGQYEEAFKFYNQAIRLRPDNFEALHNLTTALLINDQIDAAIDTARRSLQIRPNSHEALNSLGQALHRKGERQEAIAILRRSIELGPQHAPAHTNLGIALESIGDIAAAVAACAQAIRLDPNNASFWINYGKILQSARDEDAAAQAFREAIRLTPKKYDGYFNLGNALHNKRQFDPAIEAFRQALEIKPKDAGVWNNLALSLHDKGDYTQEIRAYETALSLAPQSPLVRYNLGLTRLLLGDFQNGWAGYEFRTSTKELDITWQDFPQPRWDGSALNGQRILLHVEQAFGDTIQFIRYIPQVVARGGKVIFQVQPELFRLLKDIAGPEQVIPFGDPLPEFDVHCPLLSLPMVFHTDIQTIPREVPYLFPDPQIVEDWRARLAGDNRLKIGLVWAGRPQHKNDHNRSLPAHAFAPLGQLSDVRFFSLQKGDAAKQLADLSSQLDITDFTSDLNDFVDTAALIQNLDLVITVDTAMAHLAGAMGKPTWVLLPFVPDWRWLLDRSDSPWYPTARLFRQQRIGEWKTVVNEVVAALSESAKNNR